jgi:hypothetical protein
MAERLSDGPDGSLGALLEHNRSVAVRELSVDRMVRRLENLIVEAGWRP